MAGKDNPFAPFARYGERHNPFSRFAPRRADTERAEAFQDPYSQQAANLDNTAALDVAKTIPAGLTRGVAALAGLPRLLDDWVADPLAQVPGRAYNYFLGDGTFEMPKKLREGAARARERIGYNTPSYDQIVSGIESVTGELHKPQTVAGEYANTVAEFLPGAAIAPGTLPQRLAQVVIPAFVSETAGQGTRAVAPNYEAPVRFAATLASGIGVNRFQSPNTAQSQLGAGLRNVDDATLLAARNLMDDAASQGVRLTWPEAINQVTRGAAPRLTQLQRVVENSADGAKTMGPFMADRARQVQQAAGPAIGGLADNVLTPEITGARTMRAAENAIAQLERSRSRLARGPYLAAQADRVPAARVEGIAKALDDIIAADPTGQLSATARTLRAQLVESPAVAGTPATRREVLNARGQFIRYQNIPATPGRPEQLRTNAVDLDDIHKVLRDAVGTTRPPPTAPSAERMEWARANQALRLLDDAITDSSSAIRQGRQIYQQATRDVIEPAAASPLGTIRETSIAQGQLQAQGNALLQPRPMPGTEVGVAQTVQRLSRQDPIAAQNLIASTVRQTFDEATQSLQGGANAFGGAKFSAVLTGNSQQAKNLEAAVRALPDGDLRWNGLKRFLDVMEATGQRAPQGSATAFNQEIQRELRKGGMVGEAANIAATGGAGWFGRARTFYEDLRFGKNSEELARLITDPKALPLFRSLLGQRQDSRAAQALAVRIHSLMVAEGDAPRPAQTVPSGGHQSR